MTPKEQALAAFQKWYGALKLYHAPDFPAKATMIGALHVLHRLQNDKFSLEIGDHLALSGTQITGLGETSIPRLLKIYGEERSFIKVARTNRGLRKAMEDMLKALKNVDWDHIDQHERYACLEELKRFMMARIRDFLDQGQLKIISDPFKSTWHSVRDLLQKAHETGKDGPVAQYLVGAKLQQRFPDLHIGNESYSTADDQLGRPGDFQIADTVFHVTMRPLDNVYEKCLENINAGFRPYLLVPDTLVVKTRQKAESRAPNQITVISIESFVGQNIEEMSEFSKENIAEEFYRLLCLYNQRVVETESDQSMLIEIPPSLAEYGAKQQIDSVDKSGSHAIPSPTLPEDNSSDKHKILTLPFDSI